MAKTPYLRRVTKIAGPEFKLATADVSALIAEHDGIGAAGSVIGVDQEQLRGASALAFDLLVAPHLGEHSDEARRAIRDEAERVWAAAYLSGWMTRRRRGGPAPGDDLVGAVTECASEPRAALLRWIEDGAGVALVEGLAVPLYRLLNTLGESSNTMLGIVGSLIDHAVACAVR